MFALADGAADAPEDGSAICYALSGASYEDAARFTTAEALPGGCSAADCAAYLRGEADSALTAAVSQRLYTDSPENTARALLRLSVGYPLYGGLSFTECREIPMMDDGYVLELDCNYNLHGFVTSDAPITSVTATITHGVHNGSLYPYVRTVSFTPEQNITCYDINEVPEGGKASLNNLTKFSSLRYGPQTLVITATSTEQTEPVELVRADFTIEKQRWLQLAQTYFSDNYSQALAFFGDPERFLFRYRWRGGRGIVLDPQWRSEYLVEDVWGRVHKDAQPYFEQARQYIDNTFFRVSGAEHDTGVLPLSELVIKNDGTCIARFISSRKYVSHHSLGTVVDLNADLSPNKQRARNRSIIYDAVKNHLVYNGIKADENGTKYYDFTYTGGYRNAVKEVPPEIVNYLLYEFAFYRAGFRWGFYFDSSDAMHFTLTESRREYFEEGAYALRKVYEYIGD